jgi:hypothetical protein
MRILIPLFLMLVFLGTASCGGSASTGTANNNSAANSAATRTSNPNWPYPDWVPAQTAALDKAEARVFKAGKVTEINLSIPADWLKLADRESMILLRSPISGPEGSPFANLGVQLDSMKPVMGLPAMDQKRHFDYSAFEPDAAYKDYLQKKASNPAFGQTQQIAIDGVWGVLEQVVHESSAPENSSQKGKEASWQWTTFFKAKSDTSKFEIFLSYPIAEADKYMAVLNGVLNTVKIKRSPGVIMLESQPQ